MGSNTVRDKPVLLEKGGHHGRLRAQTSRQATGREQETEEQHQIYLAAYPARHSMSRQQESAEEKRKPKRKKSPPSQ
ncbi:hypothetical protein LSH36_15g01001, partial [Paralvinella palmiformis]